MNCLFLKDFETGAEQHWWCGPVSHAAGAVLHPALARTRPKATAGSCRSATGSSRAPHRPAAVRRARDREGPDRHDPRADPPALRLPRQLRHQRGAGAAGEGNRSRPRRWRRSTTALSARCFGMALQRPMRPARLLAILGAALRAAGAARAEEGEYRAARTRGAIPTFAAPGRSTSTRAHPARTARRFGDRVWLTDEEFAERLAHAERSDASLRDG